MSRKLGKKSRQFAPFISHLCTSYKCDEVSGATYFFCFFYYFTFLTNRFSIVYSNAFSIRYYNLRDLRDRFFLPWLLLSPSLGLCTHRVLLSGLWWLSSNSSYQLEILQNISICSLNWKYNLSRIVSSHPILVFKNSRRYLAEILHEAAGVHQICEY